MRGSVSNDNLITHQQASASPHDLNSDSPLAGEVVHFCIVDSAYLRFNDGELQTYTLSVDSVAHFGSFPRTDENFARSLLSELATVQTSSTDDHQKLMDVRELITQHD